MEYSNWGANHEYLDFAYNLGKIWYNNLGPESQKISWLIPLFSCAICLYLAEAKSRNRLFWGVAGFTIPFISAAALLVSPKKTRAKIKPYKASRQRREQAEPLIKTLKNSAGQFEVGLQSLAEAQNIEVADYVKNYLHSNALPGCSIDAGGDVSPRFFVFNHPISYDNDLSTLSEILAQARFSVNQEDTALAEDITELFIHQIISEDEYKKSVAAIAYNSGNNTVNLAKKDIYGALVYQGETEKLAAKLAAQFFSDFCSSKYEVDALFALHCHKLP